VRVGPFSWLLALAACSESGGVWSGPTSAPREWITGRPIAQRFEYDGAYLRSAFDGTASYVYDDRGLLIEERGGELIRYRYDAQDRLELAVHEDLGIELESESFNYNDEGRLGAWLREVSVEGAQPGSERSWETVGREERSYRDGVLRSLDVYAREELQVSYVFLHDDAGRLIAQQAWYPGPEPTPAKGELIEWVWDDDGRLLEEHRVGLVLTFWYTDDLEIFEVDLTRADGTLGSFTIERDSSVDAGFWTGPWNVRDDRPGGYRSLFARDR
jgi:hypothetical protein